MSNLVFFLFILTMLPNLFMIKWMKNTMEWNKRQGEAIQQLFGHMSDAFAHLQILNARLTPPRTESEKKE